ncbi:hypothetical protein Tco_0721233 [Tanacetum coccineum]
MKKAFQDMLHELGEVNPTHAYYNGSCTIKDTEDPSWSTSFKTRRTQKTSSALEVLWKTLFVLYLYLIGTLLAMSSDNESSAVPYSSISFDSDGPSWGIPLVNADKLLEWPLRGEGDIDEDSIDYPDEPEDDNEDLEEDDDEDLEEDPEEDPNEEHEPEDEDTERRSPLRF